MYNTAILITTVMNSEVNYRLDGEANPLYWWPYRMMFNNLVGKVLTTPGMKLVQTDCDRKCQFVVGFLTSNELDWTDFDFTQADRADDLFGLPIGKSANIDFTISAGIERHKIDMNIVTDAILRRKAKPSDHLYGAHICAIENAGWTTHWTPLPQNQLHLSLLPQASFEDPKFQPKKRDKQKLVNNFWLIK